MPQKQTICVVNGRNTLEIMNYVFDDGYTKPHGVIQYIDYEKKKLICQETWNMGMFVNSVNYPLAIPIEKEVIFKFM